MKYKERKKLADFLRGRAQGAHSDAILCLEEAISTLRSDMGDLQDAEQAIGNALVFVGEARGFSNSAADIAEREDEEIPDAADHKTPKPLPGA